MSRRRRRKDKDTDDEAEAEEQKSTSGSKPNSGGKGKSTQSGGASALTFASDPPYISIFDDTVVADYSIFCPYGVYRVDSNTHVGTFDRMVNPLVIDEAIFGDGGSSSQMTIRDTDLLGEVVFNELNRVITTPGDITMNELKAAVTEYLAYVGALIASWATTASLYGLAEAFPAGSGQMKNYLALLGAKPWQQEAKSSQLSTLPIPTNMLNYLMSWYAVKQIPDGRAMYCVPSLPCGLTPDEDNSNPRVNYGKDLEAFTTGYDAINDIADTSGNVIWPELRRILMNAGWKLYKFPTSMPVMKDGMWWDMQAVNMPFAALKGSDAPNDDFAQVNPQAGNKRRSYALSVYADNLSPYLQRMMMPIAMTSENSAYDRGSGAFDTSALGSIDELCFGSLGRYHLQSTIPNSGGFPVLAFANPVVLNVGQAQDADGLIGWSRNIGTLGQAGSGSWITSDKLATLYSEMAVVLVADEGQASADPTGLYAKIFRGESTTISSNRYKFGNTVDPNMTGTIADGASIEGYTTGNSQSLQRIYEWLIK